MCIIPEDSAFVLEGHPTVPVTFLRVHDYKKTGSLYKRASPSEAEPNRQNFSPLSSKSVIIDHEAGVIIRLVASVRLSVHPSVCLSVVPLRSITLLIL